MEEQYASGNWVVVAGRETEFVERWKDFLRWTREAAPGLITARLIQDASDQRHFVSFANWESEQALESWRAQPDFAAKLGACRALCEEFRGGNYMLAAAV